MSYSKLPSSSAAVLLVGEPVGWGVRAFGLFFLLPGLAAIWAYFNVEIQGEPLAALIVGGVFSLVGSAFVGAFKRVWIDRQWSFAESAAGVFFAFKRTRISLAGIRHVSIGREERERRSKQRTYTYFVYPVRLVGNEELECSDSLQYDYARAEAEKIARYLRLPIEDGSSGEIRRREYDELDESLARRRRKAGERARLPGMPVDTALHVHDENGVTTITLPPRGNALVQVMITVLFTIPVYFMVSSFMGLDEPNTPDWFRYWVLGIVFVPMAAQVLRLLIQMQVKHSLVLTHQDLQYVRRFILATARHITKQQLEELDLQPGRVIATADAGQLIIPVSVRKPDDTRFVYEMILYRLGQ